jgi:hypothetical protein
MQNSPCQSFSVESSPAEEPKKKANLTRAPPPEGWGYIRHRQGRWFGYGRDCFGLRPGNDKILMDSCLRRNDKKQLIRQQSWRDFTKVGSADLAALPIFVFNYAEVFPCNISRSGKYDAGVCASLTKVHETPS